MQKQFQDKNPNTYAAASLEGHVASMKSQLIGKDSDAGRDWGQEKRTTEDEMAGWHHLLNGHEFEQTPGISEGQGSLVCCSPWDLKELDTPEGLNNNNTFWRTNSPPHQHKAWHSGCRAFSMEE